MAQFLNCPQYSLTKITVMKKAIILAMLVASCIGIARADRGPDTRLKNICRIYISEKSDSLIYCHNKWMPISQVKDVLKEYIANVEDEDKLEFEVPNVGKFERKYAVIALQTDRGAKYKTYFAIQNEISKAYDELRDEFALKQWACTYNQLKPHQQKAVRMAYPMVVSDTEPRYHRTSYQ